MGFCDFVVKYDPEKDTITDITERIFYSIFISRLKAKKPFVFFLGGDSGEGKSLSAIGLLITLMKIQNINVDKVFETCNICSPLEYIEKTDKLMFDKDYKKANIVIVHEARDLVKARNWYSFLNQTIADINAMSRAVKRMGTILISQFIRDIDKSIRYTINFYGVVKRPKGKPARLYLSIMWKDDRDIDNPKLRKRRIMGYLKYPSGKYVRFMPEYIEFRLPEKKYIDWFEKMDKEAKAQSIRSKMDQLIKSIKAEMGQDGRNIEQLADYYTQNLDRLQEIGKRYKKGWKVTPKFRDMLDLTKDESKILEKRINEKLKDMGAKDGEDRE